MTDQTKVSDSVVITFFPSEEDGQISMALDLPHDYDPDNLRPYEVAALMVVQYLEETTDGFEQIHAH
jgi:hypothetical protein